MMHQARQGEWEGRPAGVLLVGMAGDGAVEKLAQQARRRACVVAEEGGTP